MSPLLPLFSYLFVMAVTPGPNNIMLAVSGVNFGFRRSLPHIFGICFGNVVQVLLCASLLVMAGEWIDGGRRWLAIVGCVYLLWLATKIARAGAPGNEAVMKPLSFTEGALFQAINPKAWVMVLNTAVLFMPKGGGWVAASGLALAGLLIGLPSVAVWALGGERLRRWLAQPGALRAFNVTMALLLGVTALWLLADELAYDAIAFLSGSGV